MEILPLTPSSVPNMVDQLAWIYGETFSLPPYNESPQVVSQFHLSILNHTTRPDFAGIMAKDLDNDEIVAFCYGYRTLPGQWWYDTVTRNLTPTMIQNWFSDCFELVDLAVLPSKQGRGIGSTIFDKLMGDLPHRTAALSTIRTKIATPAHHLYEKRGWQVLNRKLAFPGINRPYMLMGKEL